MARKIVAARTTKINRSAAAPTALLEHYCRDLNSWPRSWLGLEEDLPPGEQLVACFRPFLQYLAESDLSPLYTGEVLQPPECDIIFKLFHLHVVAEGFQKRPQRFPHIVQGFRSAACIADHCHRRRRLCLAGARTFFGRNYRVRPDQLQQQKIATIAAIPQQFDIARNLSHRVLVVTGEVARDTQHARPRPVDLPRCIRTQFLLYRHREITSMISQPAEVEQTLTDDIHVQRSFVFDDHRTVVIVETKRVDASAVLLSREIFGGQKAHTKKRLEVQLHQRLEGLLDVHGFGRQLERRFGLDLK